MISDIAWVAVSIVLGFGFFVFLLWAFIDWLTEDYDIHKTFKQKNDEINRQVDESEMPGAPDKLEPKSPEQFRKKWRWGIGDK